MYRCIFLIIYSERGQQFIVKFKLKTVFNFFPNYFYNSIFYFSNLYNNRIQRIPEGAFKNLPKLTRLRLDHNALVCDCEILWLAKMLTENSLHGSANCKYPSEMYGKSLIGMQEKDFHCSKFCNIEIFNISIYFSKTKALFQVH